MLKKLRLFPALLILWLPLPAHAASTWSVALTDKAINYLAVDQHNNNVVYAAGNDANQNVYVYKSSDGGISWTWDGNGLGQFTIYSFASAFTQPERLLIGGWNQATRTGAAYKSTDGGATWTSISSLVGNQTAQAVGFGNDTADTIFIGTDQNLWVSYDGGITFKTDSAGLCPSINVHVMAGDHQLPGFLYFGLDQTTCGGVFASPDSGKTLAVSSNGLPGFNPSGTVLQVAADTNNGNGLALVGVPASASRQTGPAPYSIWKTTNHGQFWTPVTDTDPVNSIIWDGANDFNVYYTSSTGLYASNDQGAHFQYASAAGTNGPVALMSTPSRVITGGAHGVAVYDLTQGPIPQQVPTTSNPAPAGGASAPGANTGPCQFILGFKTLHDLASADVGDCADNQIFAGNGDAQQHTSKGLLAWRKADNWTAFTNGYLTWINGPTGLVKRLNTQRFSWEANPDKLPVIKG